MELSTQTREKRHLLYSDTIIHLKSSAAIIHCLQITKRSSEHGNLCVAAMRHHYAHSVYTLRQSGHFCRFNNFCIAGTEEFCSLPDLANFTRYFSLFGLIGNISLNLSLSTHFNANLFARICLRSLRFCNLSFSRAEM